MQMMRQAEVITNPPQKRKVKYFAKNLNFPIMLRVLIYSCFLHAEAKVADPKTKRAATAKKPKYHISDDSDDDF